jgi:hypothetical protein
VLGLLQQGFQQRPGLSEPALLQERDDLCHRRYLQSRRLLGYLNLPAGEHHRQLSAHQEAETMEVPAHRAVGRSWH